MTAMLDDFDDHPKGENEEFAPQLFHTTEEVIANFEFLGLPDKGTDKRMDLAEQITVALAEILSEYA